MPDGAGGHVPKVVDFGIAKLANAASPAITQRGMIVGSPEYMSPEQADGQLDVGGQTDVWAFSVVMYELITGRRPFSGETLSAVIVSIFSKEPVPTTELGAGDEALWAILRRGLAKSPADRWPSMRALGRALAAWAVERGVTADVAGTSLAHQWLARGAEPPLAAEDGGHDRRACGRDLRGGGSGAAPGLRAGGAGRAADAGGRARRAPGRHHQDAQGMARSSARARAPAVAPEGARCRGPRLRRASGRRPGAGRAGWKGERGHRLDRRSLRPLLPSSAWAARRKRCGRRPSAAPSIRVAPPDAGARRAAASETAVRGAPADSAPAERDEQSDPWEGPSDPWDELLPAPGGAARTGGRAAWPADRAARSGGRAARWGPSRVAEPRAPASCVPASAACLHVHAAAGGARLLRWSCALPG